ncbi:class I adenylate-forming enzyme family protein [Rhodococcus sp. USK13]|uniref:class I adenylate-forming enzyme family protein n=1 Tax=Rhodococcus sp. USK13 TaxID=2806442 RepID=UPI001BCE2D9F|nr:class I adenylate-forming enzyme family protein [Rhodococcus sp. USK13]
MSTTPTLPAIVSGAPLEGEPGLGSLTLPGFLREVTETFSDREALTMQVDAQIVRWTYADLWERAIEVAQALRSTGLGKESRVGILMTNRPEWLSAVFGTSLAGGVAVTLSTFSTPAELDHLLKVSGVSVLLFERQVLKQNFADILTDLEPRIATAAPGALRSSKYPFLRHLAAVTDTTPADQSGDGSIESWPTFLTRGVSESREVVEACAATTAPSDTAVLFFSSGSTSKPKGILSAHRGVAIQMWRFRRMYGLSPEDNVRCWSANGFFWSGNFGMALGSTLASGGSLILQRTFDADEALRLMDAEKVNFPVAWPHQWAALEASPNWDSVDLSHMRFVDFNTPIAKHKTVSTKYSEPGHAYGNTETFTISTCFPANTPDEEIAGSSGIPLPGNSVKIVDALTGATLRIGERGEICVKGPTLMLGYVGTPLMETLDAEGFFHTGDGGYLDDSGRLFWEGRLTDIIKTGGANVSPLEVDEVILGLPGVKVTRTVGVPHETLGEVVVACIVPQDRASLDPEAIRTLIKEKLASYKVPRHVLFFSDNEISMTGSAKIRTDELRNLASAKIDSANR